MLTKDQLVNVLLAIDKVHRVPQMALDCGPGLMTMTMKIFYLIINLQIALYIIKCHIFYKLQNVLETIIKTNWVGYARFMSPTVPL